MKRIYYFASAIFFVSSFISCTDTITDEIATKNGSNNTTKQELTFIANIGSWSDDSSETRTVLSNGKVNWMVGDSIHVWNITGGEACFNYNGSDSKFTGSIPAQTGDKLYAFYPAPASLMDLTLSGEKFTFTSFASQEHKENSFADEANPMVGYAECDLSSATMTLPFKNVCGILKMNLTAKDDGKVYRLDSIVVAHQQGEPMNNRITVTPGTGEPSIETGAGNDKVITLKCNSLLLSKAGANFYIVLPVENYDNARISFYGTCDGARTVNTISNCKFNIKRSKITSMPSKEILSEESGSITDGRSAYRLGDYAIQFDIADLTAQLDPKRKYFLSIGNRNGQYGFLVKIPNAANWILNSATPNSASLRYDAGTQILSASYNAFSAMVNVLEPLDNKVTTCYIEDWGTGVSCVNSKAYHFNYDATSNVHLHGYGTVRRTGEFSLEADFTNVTFIDYSCYGLYLENLGQLMSYNQTNVVTDKYNGVGKWSNYSYPSGFFYTGRVNSTAYPKLTYMAGHSNAGVTGASSTVASQPSVILDQLDNPKGYTIYSNCYVNGGNTKRTSLSLSYKDDRHYPTVSVKYAPNTALADTYNFYITFSEPFMTNGIYELRTDVSGGSYKNVMSKLSIQNTNWSIGTAAGYYFTLSGPVRNSDGSLTYTLTPRNREPETRDYCANVIKSTANWRVERGYLTGNFFTSKNVIIPITPTTK